MKAWGGRFDKNTDKFVEEFTASLPVDVRLYRQDIAGSMAHASMLAKCSIISDEEADRIREGLAEIFREINAGEFTFHLADEDIHMSIERALIEKIGPAGGKLHTARSRNDQVTLDLRMYLKEEIWGICSQVASLQGVITGLAGEHLGTVMPGYTHLQRAQPVLLAQHLLAYFFMLVRDFERFRAAYQSADSMPLGSAALAGTGFPIDRRYVAEQLGFSRVTENSIDAVSDRDFALDFAASAATLMVHLSRLSEELVIWSSAEFGFVTLDESYTTGSSIMPQKRNPDVAELIRGKAARVVGNLAQLLVLLKGLPLAYDRDLQEDKEPVFDTVDTVRMCLEGMRGMLQTMKVNEVRMAEAAGSGLVNATELADYLVRKGVPFREAHQVVGSIVKFCETSQSRFEELDLATLQGFHRAFDADVLESLDLEESIKRKDSEGGTAPSRIREQLDRAVAIMSDESTWLEAVRPKA